MKFVLERVSEPEIEPVTLAEMKLHLRCFDSITSEDEMIESLITAGREWVEDYTGRALIDQTWRLIIGENNNPFFCNDIVSGNQLSGRCGKNFNIKTVGEIFLRKSPAIQILSFVTVDASGEETEVDPANYMLMQEKSKWPKLIGLNGTRFYQNSLIKITFRAGYADRTGSPLEGAEVVPARFKSAIKLWVEANYDRDSEMMKKLLEVAESIIKSERSDLQIS